MGRKLKTALNIILLVAGFIAIFYSALLMSLYAIDFGMIFTFLAGSAVVIVSMSELFLEKGFILFRNKYLKRVILFFVITGFTFFAAIEGLLYFSGSNDPVVETDCLIVLGAGLFGDKLSPVLKERMDKALWYLGEYPNVPVVVSGGQGPGELIPEAEAMKRYLVENGIEEERIIIEDKSTSTMENFIYSKEILINIGLPCETITIVTNDFHMLRAKMLAERNGFIAYSLPGKTPAIVRANCYIREFFALIKSFFLDV